MRPGAPGLRLGRTAVTGVPSQEFLDSTQPPEQPRTDDVLLRALAFSRSTGAVRSAAFALPREHHGQPPSLRGRLDQLSISFLPDVLTTRCARVHGGTEKTGRGDCRIPHPASRRTRTPPMFLSSGGHRAAGSRSRALQTKNIWRIRQAGIAAWRIRQMFLVWRGSELILLPRSSPERAGSCRSSNTVAEPLRSA